MPPNPPVFGGLASPEPGFSYIEEAADGERRPQHAYGIAGRLEQIAEQPFRLNQGTLYPALVRLEQRGWIKGTWQTTESNREAKYYAITRSGLRALDEQVERWRKLSGLVNKLIVGPS